MRLLPCDQPCSQGTEREQRILPTFLLLQTMLSSNTSLDTNKSSLGLTSHQSGAYALKCNINCMCDTTLLIKSLKIFNKSGPNSFHDPENRTLNCLQRAQAQHHRHSEKQRPGTVMPVPPPGAAGRACNGAFKRRGGEDFSSPPRRLVSVPGRCISPELVVRKHQSEPIPLRGGLARQGRH